MTTADDLPLLPRRRFRFGSILGALGPMIALLLIVGVTAIIDANVNETSRYLTLENQMNILRQWSFVGIVALGMTFVIISGGIDLSVGSIVAFAGGLGIWTMNTALTAPRMIAAVARAKEREMDAPYSGFRIWLAEFFTHRGWAENEPAAVWIAVVTVLLLGTFAGLLNGLLVAKGKLAPFIATLGGFAAYRSLALAAADGGEYRSGSSKLFPIMGTKGLQIPFIEVREGVAMTIPWSVLTFFGLAIVLTIVLNRTRYGRYVVAVGNNERAARYSAINVDRIKIITYTLIGFTCGVAALLLGSRMNSVASSTTGQQYELDAIAAVVIGGTRMTGGAGSIFGTVIGVMILGQVSNMLNFLQISPYLQGLVKGVIIIGAVLIQRIGRKST